MAYKEFYDSKDDMPRNWGYQSIPVSQEYRDNYDAIRWDSVDSSDTVKEEPKKVV